jgi:DNA-binding CsgD family transcriptional regulator
MYSYQTVPSVPHPAPLRPPTVTEPGHSLLTAVAWDHLRATLNLSPREAQVVCGVFDDYKEEQIARELGISRHTVNTYLQRLYRKLRVGSRSQLIVRVIAEHLKTGVACHGRLTAAGGSKNDPHVTWQRDR